MRMNHLFKGVMGVFSGAALSGAVYAQNLIEGAERIGKPGAGAMGFQPASTVLADDQQWLDGMVLTIITAITILVTVLLIWVMIRYNGKVNKTPARFTHNSLIEIAWTAIPIVILIVIGSFSLPILFKQLEIPDPDLTVKVTGNQWYWSYEYPESGVGFDSFMIGQGAVGLTDEVAAELEAAGYTRDEYLLAADNALVVPVGKVVQILVTGSDVNHSFAVPSFGIKIDAIVGRLNETWIQVDKPGLYFGQCSELCGVNHSYMPIVVRALEPAEFDAWLQGQMSAMLDVPADVQVATSN